MNILMDAYIRALISLSRVRDVFAAVLIGGRACSSICEMVFVRYVLNENDDLADRFRHLQPSSPRPSSAAPYVLMTRGHVNVDVLPLYLGPRAPLLARAVHDRCLALALLPGDDRSLHVQFWYEAWRERLALEHGVARAAVDSLCCHAGRARAF